jgi:hypothetical protein
LNGMRLVPLRLIGRSKLESIHDVVPTPFLTDTAGVKWQHDMPLECSAPVEVRASVYMSTGVATPSPQPSPSGRGGKKWVVARQKSVDNHSVSSIIARNS